jgi:hypothetical protein
MAKHPDRIDVTLPVEAALIRRGVVDGLERPFRTSGIATAKWWLRSRRRGVAIRERNWAFAQFDALMLFGAVGVQAGCRWRQARGQSGRRRGTTPPRPPGPRWSGRERHSLTKPVKSVSERAGSHARQPGGRWPAVSRALNPGRFLPRVARSRICRMRARAREFAVSAVHPRSLVEATPLRRALWTRSAPPRGPDHGRRGG